MHIHQIDNSVWIKPVLLACFTIVGHSILKIWPATAAGHLSVVAHVKGFPALSHTNAAQMGPDLGL